MGQKAKLFMNGRSQAVRLPVDFRFDCEEVYIRRDENTHNVTRGVQRLPHHVKERPVRQLRRSLGW